MSRMIHLLPCVVLLAASPLGFSQEPARVTLELTAQPAMGEETDLAGVVRGVEPSACHVAVYVEVGGRWWTKPSFEAPRVPVAADGTFTADVTTGGDDAFARQIAVFVLPTGFEPPIANNATELPASLEQKALAKTVIRREGRRPRGAASSRTLQFAGRSWKVKAFDFPVGPGPNRFSGREEDVYADERGLHLTIRQRDSQWYCTEVVLDESLGYGTYAFYTGSRVDKLDPRVVAGLFTWETEAPPPHRELDFEYSRWSKPEDPTNAQFVVQPFERPGNLVRYRVDLTDEAPQLTHVLVWSKGRADFLTARGVHAPDAVPHEAVIAAWTITGEVIPEPGHENVRINLWLDHGLPPMNGQLAELLVTDFRYLPPQ